MNQEELIIHKLFSNTVSQFPDKIALQIKRDFQWQRFTYRQVEELSLKVATFLIKEGFQKTDAAALILENRPEWPQIYLGLMYAGLVCVPLDYQLSSEEIKKFILNSNAKILFCSDEIFTKKIKSDIQELLTKIVIVDLIGSPEGNRISFAEIKKITPEETPILVEPQDVASLIYTSGTTGEPKGVMLTHENICSNFLSLKKLNLCLPADNFFSMLPLHHTYPFMVSLIVPLFHGATVTFPPLGFKPRDLASIIKEAKVSFLVGVPQLFYLMHSAISEKIKGLPNFLRLAILPFLRINVKRKFGKNLRQLVSGGARLDPQIARNLTRFGFKITEGYGLTETSPVVTFNPLGKVKFGSVGKPIPNVQIMIHNPNNKGEGQILIKGPNVMKGYFKQPELTASIIKDDWFYSGDLGYIDKDGYLFITGREKEVIILSSGKTIYPEELENYYNQSPYIKEICILQKQQELFGNIVDSLYAVVVPNLDYFQQKNQTRIAAIIRWELENLGKKLPPYKHIMGFTLAKEGLPRTVLKKLERYKVKEIYLEQEASPLVAEEQEPSAEDSRLLRQDIAQKIINYIAARLKKPVNLNSHLEIDLGIDSLSWVELGLGLEALLSMKIPDDVLYAASTVREVIINILDLREKAKSLQAYEPTKEQKSWSQILKELPSEELRQGIRIKIQISDWLITGIFKIIFVFIFRIFWLLRVKGVDSLPKTGPYLVCPNHASYLDGLVVFSALPLRLTTNTYFLGYSDIFEHPLLKWSIKLARVIPIDPGRNFTEAMQAVSFVLSQKKIACIFPEGRRSIDDSVGEFKKGVGILIKELEIPVVPIYIKGSHYSWPRTKRLPRFYPLKIIFGRPMRWQELIRKHIGEFADDYEATAQGLREEVVKLKC